MNCREFTDFLMAYLEDALRQDERGRFQEHMDACPSCVVYLDTYRETIRLGRLCAEAEGPVPEEVPEELVRAVLRARGAGD